MEQKEWELHKTGIGGSDAAVILGISPFKTEYQLWLEKTDPDWRPSERSTPAQQFGHIAEQWMVQWYQEYVDNSTEPKVGIRHPKYPFLIANLDALSHDRIVEAKTARCTKQWGEEGTDQIPPIYMAQIQHNMMVAQKNIADVILLSFGAAMPTIYTVYASTNIQDFILKKELEFWEYVKSKKQPKLTSPDDILEYFDRNAKQETTILADEDTVDMVNKLKEMKEKIKQNELTVKLLQAIIIKYMDVHETLIDIDAKPLVTYKKTKPSKWFDREAFKKDNPEIYRKYEKTKEGYRRFNLK